MKNTAVLFSGQGSQYVGMAQEFYEKYDGAKNVFEIAESVLGFDLKDICFNGPEDELSKTKVAQPAILATSLCALEAAKAEGIEFSAVAGHSLGEYAAMVAAEIITTREAFEIIKERARAMHKASEKTNGAMAAIIGLSADEIEEACSSVDGYVVPVNYNSNAQTVIAGEVSAVEKVGEILAEKKARVMKLNVSSAFHSKLMQGAADEFYDKIKDREFSQPKVKFLSNLTGGELTDFSDMPKYLASHIVSPVKFTSELNLLNEQGYTKFVELGPNKVLTGLVKKTLKGVVAVNVENLKTLEKAKSELV